MGVGYGFRAKARKPDTILCSVVIINTVGVYLLVFTSWCLLLVYQSLAR